MIIFPLFNICLYISCINYLVYNSLIKIQSHALLSMPSLASSYRICKPYRNLYINCRILSKVGLDIFLVFYTKY